MKKTKLLIALCLAGCMAKAQTISTIAGTGTSGFSGDGGQATLANLSAPSGVAIDALGNTYIADSDNERIRKVNTAGIISTFVGNGTAGFSGDGGQATAAKINNPFGLAIDSYGNLYFSDHGNYRIRKVIHQRHLFYYG